MDITLLVLCDDTLGNVMFVTHKGVFRYVSSVNDRSGMRGARILEWYVWYHGEIWSLSVSYWMKRNRYYVGKYHMECGNTSEMFLRRTGSSILWRDEGRV